MPLISTLRFLLPLLCLLAFRASAGGDVLVMGYPERDKMPMIDAAPDNEGVFKDLFSEAARRAGMKLEIRRLPKKRLYEEMAHGTIDFYPSAAFSASRVEFMHWIDNGMKSREVCLTRKEVPTIRNLSQAPPLRVAVELGGLKLDKALYPQLSFHEQPIYIDMDNAEKLLNRQLADLLMTDIEVVDYFKKKRGIKDLAELGLKLHEDCIEKLGPTYLGFARKSSKYAERPNPDYKPDLPPSGTNQPGLLDRNSVAGRLAVILQQMKAQGETQKILKRHLH